MGQLTIGERLLESTLLALLVTIAAYGLMLIAGLPIAWALDRAGRFRPAIVAPIGAAMGFLPFVYAWFQDSPKAATDLAGIHFTGAIAGGLCALSFWALSGRGRRPAAGSIAGAGGQDPTTSPATPPS